MRSRIRKKAGWSQIRKSGGLEGRSRICKAVEGKSEEGQWVHGLGLEGVSPARKRAAAPLRIPRTDGRVELGVLPAAPDIGFRSY